MARVSFFIDGFNVYHSLKSNDNYHKYLWLDYRKLLKNYLRKIDALADIYYFSAYAHWIQDRVKRHRMMIDIWKNTGILPIMGNFKEKDRYCTICRSWFKGHEEKQTDVNIAIHLIKEAYENNYDTAILFTNDTDLIPAIRMLKSSFPKKRVGVLFPIDRWSSELSKECHFWRKTKKKALAKSILPNKVTLPSGIAFTRPTSWK